MSTIFTSHDRSLMSENEQFIDVFVDNYPELKAIVGPDPDESEAGPGYVTVLVASIMRTNRLDAIRRRYFRYLRSDVKRHYELRSESGYQSECDS